MIADWTVDVSADAPSIDLPWDGWIDLRWNDRTHGPWAADAAAGLEETRTYPELIELLKAANRGDLFTSKIDVFPVTREEVDPEIAEAGEAATRYGLASYVDILTDQLERMHRFEQFEAVARLLVTNLSKMELSAPCSAEVVVRPARLFGRDTFAWTLYAMGFGPTEAAARQAWSTVAYALIVQVQRACQP